MTSRIGAPSLIESQILVARSDQLLGVTRVDCAPAACLPCLPAGTANGLCAGHGRRGCITVSEPSENPPRWERAARARLSAARIWSAGVFFVLVSGLNLTWGQPAGASGQRGVRNSPSAVGGVGNEVLPRKAKLRRIGRFPGRSARSLRADSKAAALPAPCRARQTGDRAPRKQKDAAGNEDQQARQAGAVAGGDVCLLSEENCQAPDINGGGFSDRVFFVIADDFTPVSNGTVTELCWWGAYARPVATGFEDCAGVNPDTFEIRYYRDAGGVPGELLAEFSQAGGSLAVTGPDPTGAQLAGILPEYAFNATHAPVPVNAGECYWVEISNNPNSQEVVECLWLWEESLEGNGRAMQDADDPLNGFEAGESIDFDQAFCLNVALDDPAPCVPPPPDNDDCANALPLEGTGIFPYDNTEATTDGLAHAQCIVFQQAQIANDVWFAWTAPCSGVASVQTCGRTTADTKIAAYRGGGQCPPSETELLFCNDDFCGPSGDAVQSEMWFRVFEGRPYLIRIGVFPGAPRRTGAFQLTCDEPVSNPACPGGGDCLAPTAPFSPGCTDPACCELVCTCDPFCCGEDNGVWDEFCAASGIEAPGCGARRLCSGCGEETAGDCCSANGTPGCSVASCCEAVCACDPLCCSVEWDEQCATQNEEGTCGAAVVCPELCAPRFCPTPAPGEVRFIEPLIDSPDGIIDPRQPHPPDDAALQQGIDRFVLTAPSGADEDCFTICENALLTAGTNNRIIDVTEEVTKEGSVYTVRLEQPVAPCAAIVLFFTPNVGSAVTGILIHHPGNVDTDGSVSGSDVAFLKAVLLGLRQPPDRLLSADIDHSGAVRLGDFLRLIDLLNSGDALAPEWPECSLPGPGSCPTQ